MKDSNNLFQKPQSVQIPQHHKTEALDNGQYANHKPIALDVLKAKINDDNVSRQEFRELCIRDLKNKYTETWNHSL